MKLLADLHTHSKYSGFFHARNTIEQMAITANELGLVEIAITDHGYNHWCGTSLKRLIDARMQVDEINKWSKTKVLLGVEADIISEDGTLDIDNDTLALIDVLVVGYHKLIKTDFANYFGGQKDTKEAIEKATNAYVNAIEKYPITIISHLDSILTTDLYRIGKACADKGVMVEINSRHCKWTEKQVNELLNSGCMFVLSSDAHRREDVGNVNRAVKIVEKYNIPKNLIANVELDDFEKDEDDLEIDQYYSIYQAKKKAKEEKEAALAEKKKTQFTNSLSDEMEFKLRQIAKEKGLYYEEEPSEEDIFDTYQKFKTTFSETEELIKSAKEYLSDNKIREFDTQNTKVDDSSFMIGNLVDDEEDESAVESADSSTFNIFAEEPKEENLNVKPTQEVQVEVKPEIKQESENLSSDQKILGIMQKTDKPLPKQTTTVQRGSSIVRNETAASKSKPAARNRQSLQTFMQSIKDETKEETKPKEEKKEEKPPVAAKKGRGGVFIQIDVNDDKK